MIKYKIDILEELNKCGFNRIRLRRNKLFSQQTLQNISDQRKIDTLSIEEIQKDARLYTRYKEGIPLISLDTLNKICIILKKKPSDVIEVVQTDDETIKIFK